MLARSLFSKRVTVYRPDEAARLASFTLAGESSRLATVKSVVIESKKLPCRDSSRHSQPGRVQRGPLFIGANLRPGSRALGRSLGAADGSPVSVSVTGVSGGTAENPVEILRNASGPFIARRDRSL